MSVFVETPMFGLALTVGGFLLGKWVQKKTGWILANPLMIGTCFCLAVIMLFGIPLEQFQLGADIIDMMLLPVTAVLALGIYNQRAVLKEYFIPVLLGCAAGSATAIFSIYGLCRLFKVDQAIAASILPKSCTTPIAMSICESRGGIAAVAAFCVFVAGFTGAVCSPLFAKWFGIKEPVAQGLAVGACSHALGTTKAREMGELQGAMSSIAIGICGLISVFLVLLLPSA